MPPSGRTAARPSGPRPRPRRGPVRARYRLTRRALPYRTDLQQSLKAQPSPARRGEGRAVIRCTCGWALRVSAGLSASVPGPRSQVSGGGPIGTHRLTPAARPCVARWPLRKRAAEDRREQATSTDLFSARARKGRNLRLGSLSYPLRDRKKESSQHFSCK